ncbi:DUF6438 domain-containing protein [Flavipsychrobacter stenotrophus]|uniref:DUF6438 domain-containing protein n=1 Tax=Flavipsychrobacter stenotrophus TaxID=2077091 RepID=UPI0010575919|nr:DUF6438 domain-containing protein [Flavipsychrobacter stenotrophus]
MNDRLLAFITSLFLCFTSFSSLANEIDSLKTRHDVNKFITDRLSSRWNGILLECKALPSDFDPNKFDPSLDTEDLFYKADLDGNGLTDLIVCGVRKFAITDEGEGKYVPHFIDTYCMDEMKKLVNIIYKPSGTWLVLQRYAGDFVPDAKPDTLVYKYGQMLELNRSPDHFDIQYVSFKATACYGACPSFEMQINPNGFVSYEGNGNAQIGFKRAYLDSVETDDLFNTLNYVNVTKLRDSYTIQITDMPTYTIEVVFRDGRSKRISDYGGCAPLAIQILFEDMFTIARKNEWVRDER